MTNDKPSAGLKSCPFCASANVDPEGWATLPQYANTPEERSGPACDDCGASAETVTIWNTRPPATGAEVVVMRSALEQIIQAYVDAPGWPAPTPTGELIWKMYITASAALRALSTPLAQPAATESQSHDD